MWFSERTQSEQDRKEQTYMKEQDRQDISSPLPASPLPSLMESRKSKLIWKSMEEQDRQDISSSLPASPLPTLNDYDD